MRRAGALDLADATVARDRTRAEMAAQHDGVGLMRVRQEVARGGAQIGAVENHADAPESLAAERRAGQPGVRAAAAGFLTLLQGSDTAIDFGKMGKIRRGGQGDCGHGE